MAMEYIIANLRIVAIINMVDLDIMEERLSQLVALEEERLIFGFHK